MNTSVTEVFYLIEFVVMFATDEAQAGKLVLKNMKLGTQAVIVEEALVSTLRESLSKL